MLQWRSGRLCCALLNRRAVLINDVCRSCRPSSLTLKRVTVKSSTNTGAAPWRGPNSALMVISARHLRQFHATAASALAKITKTTSCVPSTDEARQGGEPNFLFF